MSAITPKVSLSYARTSGQKYYRPAGGFNPAAIALAVVAGAVAAAVLAVPYVYAIKYMPEIKLSALCTVAAGAAFGVVPAVVLKRLKVRSRTATLIACMIVGLAGLGAAWVVWEATLLKGGLVENVTDLVKHPRAVVDLGVEIEDVGTWSMGHGYGSSPTRSDNVKGWFLLAIWAGEAATLVGTAAVVGLVMIGSVPFCEACGTWCGPRKLVRSTATVADPATLKQKLEDGDFAHVATLGPPTGNGDTAEFGVHSCPSCKQFNTLTVTNKSVAHDKKGKVVSNTSATLVDRLIVSSADVAKLSPGAPAGA